MPETSLKVTIIGGGLAGALAGRFLRENHSVTILERSSDPIEAGAAISIGPNGTRLLASVGFDPVRTGSIPVGTIRMWNKDGKVMLEKEMDFMKDYGSHWYFQHRADLRAEFLRLASAPSKELNISGKPAIIRYGSRVVDVDVEEGLVTLENGVVIESDLVIAADGVKSMMRPLVVGDEAFTFARPSGLSAFRFTLNRDLVLANFPDFYLLDKTKPAIFEMIFSLDPTRRSVVLYPCRHYEVLNFVCIVPDTKLKNTTTESWSAMGDLSELLSCFEDFPTWLLDLVNLASNIMLWQLRDQDPLPTYVKGRTVLIGDAAHAMTPHQGQGGTQAVEDAEGFVLFNKPGITRADVPAVLKDFDAVRRPRASRIQNNTRTVVGKRSPEEMEAFERYNWTYPGVMEGLRRLNAGEELIQFQGVELQTRRLGVGSRRGEQAS